MYIVYSVHNNNMLYSIKKKNKQTNKQTKKL